MIPSKPKSGSSCNGCGVCCIAETCAVGLEAFGLSHQVCPALYWEENRFYCGLMTRPFEYIQPEMDGSYLSKAIHGFGEELSASYYQDLIGAAKGCDSADE